jgi:hypothetical protein
MTTLHEVSANCGDEHHISVKTTSNSIPLIHLRCFICSLEQSSSILSCHSFSVTPLCSISEGPPLLIRGLEDFFPWRKSLQPYNISVWSPRSLQLMSPYGIEKPTAGSFLIGWWAIQIAILPWIVPVCSGASPASIARWKMHFLLELAQESDYDTLPNGWRITRGYATERKDVVRGVPLLWLVTSEPSACCFPRLDDMSIALFIPSSSYTTSLCLCVSNAGRIHSLLLVIVKLYPWGFARDFAIIFPFGQSSEVITEHALELISYTNGGHHPFTLELEQGYHVYVRDSSTEGETTWLAKSFLHAN